MTRPGDILGDRWVLLERIDAGAMGEVFRAEHQVLGHAVAVKVLLPEMTRDQGAIDRFLREARIAAKLRHPNVVRVEDYGLSSDGRPYLVMELLRGESLARLLARTPRLRPSVVLALVHQIADALDTAHAAGIVHRDLKPENIFLSGPAEALTLKVLDFGVAKFTDALAAGGGATASNTLVGTPRYMSPEQAQGRPLDGRSDLYAVGVMLFQMLTGVVPFGEDDAVVVMAHHIMTPPPRVLDLNPAGNIHPSLDALVAASLQKRPGDRPASAEEFLRAIEALPVEGARAGLTSGPFGGSARHPRVTATRTATLLALLLGLGIALFTALPMRRRALAPLAPAGPAAPPRPTPAPPAPVPEAVAPVALPPPDPASAPAAYVDDAPSPAVATRARRRRSHRRSTSRTPVVSVTSPPPAPPHAPYPRWSD